IRLRGGRYKRDCYHHLSPHAVARLHARRHNLGTVYISNETIDKNIDFTKEDLSYICKQAFKVEKSKTT
ncbi:MAG: hypothetical protein ACKPKO_39995, partial [Candidatus Fonsibacter sp.]